jgi:hypothetical protein
LFELAKKAFDLCVRGRLFPLFDWRLRQLAVLRPFICKQYHCLSQVKRTECRIDRYGDDRVCKGDLVRFEAGAFGAEQYRRAGGL